MNANTRRLKGRHRRNFAIIGGKRTSTAPSGKVDSDCGGRWLRAHIERCGRGIPLGALKCKCA